MQGGRNESDWVARLRAANSYETGAGGKDQELGEESQRIVDRKNE